MPKSFWKTFIVVFTITFVANVMVVYLWNIFFHDGGWQWDTTTTTAVVVGVFMTYIFHRKKKS